MSDRDEIDIPDTVKFKVETPARDAADDIDTSSLNVTIDEATKRIIISGHIDWGDPITNSFYHTLPSRKQNYIIKRMIGAGVVEKLKSRELPEPVVITTGEGVSKGDLRRMMQRLANDCPPRQVKVLEPSPKMYKTFLNDMATFRTFTLTQEQFEMFRHAPEMQSEYRVAMPFEKFALKVEPGFVEIPYEELKLRSVGVTHLEDLQPDEALTKQRCEGITIQAVNENDFLVTTVMNGLTDATDLKFLTTALITHDGIINLKDAKFAMPDLPSAQSMASELKKNSAALRSMDAFPMQGPKVLLHFLYALDHRKVRILEQHRSRAERRADERRTGQKAAPNYIIHIPATMNAARIQDDLANDRDNYSRAKYRQEVRGHLRRDKYGRKRIVVHPFERYKDLPWRYEDAHNKYAAHNVGMEGTEDE